MVQISSEIQRIKHYTSQKLSQNIFGRKFINMFIYMHGEFYEWF
jgi:hypothetical protein